MTEIEKAEISQIGCWISSGAGWRGASEVIRIAWASGMEKTDDDEKIVDAFENDESVTLSDGTRLGRSAFHVSPSEYILDQGGMSDNAVKWLNQNAAPEGTFFGWNDGEFYLFCATTVEELEDDAVMVCPVCNGDRKSHFSQEG